jgi:Mg2+-importing ATPase
MLWGFDAGARLFHSAWFVESLATQTLVIFVIRTRHLPLRSHPSVPLLASALTAVLVGAVLPFTPFAPALGFVPLLGRIVATLAVLVLGYLVLAEVAKRQVVRPVPRARRTRQAGHRIHRRAARFSTAGPGTRGRRGR